MFYPGMPDIYRYSKDNESYIVFWHEGEFYFYKGVGVKGSEYPEKKPYGEEYYFDTSDECLKAMLEVAPYKDWKVTSNV